MNKVRADHDWPTIYVAIVALAALAFLFSVKSVLSPVVAFLVLILLISPWAGSRMHLLTVIAASGLLVIWLLQTLGSLLAPFILAFVLAYVLHPFVRRLEQRRVRRGLAVSIIFVPFFVIVVLAAAFGVPAIAQQLENLIDNAPRALQRGVVWLQAMRLKLQNSDIPFLKGEALARALDSFSAERVAEYIHSQQAALARRLWSTVLGVGKSISIALGILGYLVLTPVLTIYLLKDFEKIKQKVKALIPQDKRITWVPFLREYDLLLSGYIRGQLIEAVIVGTLTWLGLLLLDFPYPGLIGAIAGLFNLIPYVGLIVSTLPAILIALLSGNILASLLKVAVVFFTVQTIDGTLTGPRIVGGSVGLHPVWVILSLAVGGAFFGFTGLLIAMPAAVFIKLIARDALARYRTSRVFEGEPLPAE